MQEIKLKEKFKKILDNFIANLRAIYGNELISIILYGSAASGEFAEQYSNLNLLIVLKNADLEDLKKASGLINKFKFRRIRPLFLTREYINRSLDVFPIEFLDMKENYLVLAGEDIMRDININLVNLRFQCEQELKSKLITLKHQYLAINQKNKTALSNLLFNYFTSLAHILRNLARLRGKTPPYLKEDILKEVSLAFSIDTAVLSEILAAKKTEKKLTLEKIQELLTGLVSGFERIAKLVDEV